MKKKLIAQALLPAVFILAIIAAGGYFYAQLNKKGKAAETNLYALVPEDCIAIAEINDTGRLLAQLDKAEYTEELEELRISLLLKGFKESIETLSNNKAHGLSRQMNRIVISFHNPNTIKDQVLYCQLGNEDEKLIENYIQQNTSQSFPPKTLAYRGKDICIYPISATEFLACYYQPTFIAISFQEKLIEKVIDTHLDKHSVLNDPAFASVTRKAKTHMEATLYINEKNVSLGKNGKRAIPVASWGEFNIKFNQEAIYLSGIHIEPDSCLSLNNMLKKQGTVPNIPGKVLPASAYFLLQYAVSDVNSLFALTNQKPYPPQPAQNPKERADSCLYEFMKNNTGNSIALILFSTSAEAEAQESVMRISLKHEQKARQELAQLLRRMPFDGKNHATTFHSGTKSYLLATIPPFLLMENLAITAEKPEHYYACFYDNCLLIAPKATSIPSYIRQINEGNVKEGHPLFDQTYAGLAPESNMLIMGYMDKLTLLPDIYRHVMPRFFFRHKDFFQHFLLILQTTGSGGDIYPTITLDYLPTTDGKS